MVVLHVFWIKPASPVTETIERETRRKERKGVVPIRQKRESEDERSLQQNGAKDGRRGVEDGVLMLWTLVFLTYAAFSLSVWNEC